MILFARIVSQGHSSRILTTSFVWRWLAIFDKLRADDCPRDPISDTPSLHRYQMIFILPPEERGSSVMYALQLCRRCSRLRGNGAPSWHGYRTGRNYSSSWHVMWFRKEWGGAWWNVAYKVRWDKSTRSADVTLMVIFIRRLSEDDVCFPCPLYSIPLCMYPM